MEYNEKEIMALLQEHSPNTFNKLNLMKENDKEEYDELILRYEDGVILEGYVDESKTLKESSISDYEVHRSLGPSRFYPKDTTIHEDIKSNVDFDKIKEEVMLLLIMKKRSDATELISKSLLRHKKIYTIRDDTGCEVWVYCNGIYIPEGKTYIKEYCRIILTSAYTQHLANEVIGKIEVDTYIDQKDFFDNDIIEEVVVENGVLNIYTKELTEFTPDKIFFNKIPIRYDPDKTINNFSKHLLGVLKCPEDVPVMQELFGFCLVKDYFIEKAIMCTGSGRNGKSKTLEVLRRFLGAENCVNISIQEFGEKGGFSKCNLHKKLANIGADISDTYLQDTSSFKAMTGRDFISADRKFLPRIHFVNYATMIFSANQLPKTSDTTPAFWNRWVVLEFPYTFLSQKEYDIAQKDDKNVKLADSSIIDSLITSEELSGILNWALEGLTRIKAQGDYSYSKNTTEVKEMWMRKSDSFAGFCMDNVKGEWNANVSKQNLRQEYNLYCRKYKLKPVGDIAIRNYLSAEFGVFEERRTIDGDFINCWNGIRLKTKIEVFEK